MSERATIGQTPSGDSGGSQTRVPAFCTQCRSRCGCEAIVAGDRLIGIEPLPGHPSGDKLCPKGRAAAELVYHPDRLLYPMRRTAPKGSADPGWQRIGWDEALDEIAQRLTAIARDHGPEQVAFSVTTPSGSHISDAIAWIERFIRVFGSPNTIYATEVCNWHKDYATRFTYGHDIGTPDFANTDCILLWGHNPSATWLARASEIQAGLKRRARLVVVDPRPTTFARRATQWLQLRPGTDLVLALGMLKRLIDGGKYNRAFATRWTNAGLLVRRDTGRVLRESDLASDGRSHILIGRDARMGALVRYDTTTKAWCDPAAEPDLQWQGAVATATGEIACRTALACLADAVAPYTPERVAAATGVPAEELAKAVDIIAEAKSVAYFAWNGVGQSITATQTDRAISILYALTGSYGGKGGNVPGSAAPFGDIAGCDLLAPEQRAKALGLAERPLGPGLHGWVTARDVYRAVLDAAPYRVRMLMSFGTNLLVSHPDAARARAALLGLDFHVHADFFLNPTADYADIVLPVSTSWEREGLRTGFDASLEGLRRVQLRPAVIAPLGDTRSDTDIVLALAGRMGLRDRMFGLDADAGHDAILAKAGLTVDRLRRAPGGIDVASSIEMRAYAQTRDGRVRGFPTPSGLMEIYSETLLQAGQPALPRFVESDKTVATAGYPLLLGSAKTMAYCHSQHRNIASLRRLTPDPILEMSPADAAARSIGHGEWVMVTTPEGSAIAKAAVVAALKPGTVFGQHGWWTGDAAGVPTGPGDRLATNINNAIATERADPVSGSLPLRCSHCEVAKISA